MGNRITSKFSRNKDKTITPCNKTANMSVIPKSINNTNCSDMNSNKDISYKDNINTNDHCITADVDYDKIFSEEGECLFEGSYEIYANNKDDEISNEMIDFEELIDLTHENDVIKTLHDIKEFENVLGSIHSSAMANNIDENMSLDEINDFFDKLGTECDDLSSQINLGVPSNNSINITTDEIVEVNGLPNENLIEKHLTTCLETQENCVTINNSKDNLPKKLTKEPYDVNENSLPTQVTDSAENIIDNSSGTPDNDIRKHNDGENLSKTPNDVAIVSTNDISSAIQGATIHSIDHSSDTKEENSPNVICLISPAKKEEKELDTISILSSNEEAQREEDGYNSSDFEFITENEAYMDGYIINFSSNDSSSTKLDDIQHKRSNIKASNSNKLHSPAENGNISDLGEGPSGISRPRDNANRDYRQNHVIPEGDRYLDLFQGPYNPIMPMSDILILENKSIRPSPMNVQYEGIGFDKQLIGRRYQPDSSEEEHEDEAKESIKKILFLYPGENRKRRRRF